MTTESLKLRTNHSIFLYILTSCVGIWSDYIKDNERLAEKNS